MTSLGLVPVENSAALEWARGSLSQGSRLAGLVSERLTESSQAFVVAPGGAEPWRLDDVGRGISAGEASDVLGSALEALGPQGATLLIVEDDLARRGDAAAAGEVAFVGDRVLRWATLDDGQAAVVRLIRTGASGYPFNAMVCREPARALNLADGHELNHGEVAYVAESVVAVVTAVHDAETFLILGERELLDDLGDVG